MPKPIPKTIDTFYRRSNDPRSGAGGRYSLTKNFDVFSFGKKLVPHFGFVDNGANSVAIAKTLYAYNGSANRLFALDKDAVNSRCVVKYWGGSAWLEQANNTSGSGTMKEQVFFYYKGFIYMFGGNTLQRFDVTSVASFETSYQTLNPTTVAQPVLHPSDDCAYFFSDNKVYRLDDTTWDGLVLTLPANLKIVSARAHGDFLAIACTSKDLTIAAGAESFVYLWDRDSSLETVSQVSNFGRGVIRQLADLDNRLIAVMDTIYEKEIVVRAINGRFAKTLTKLTIDAAQLHYETSEIVDNRLYFPMKAPLRGDDRIGIWCVDSDGRLELDTVITGTTDYKGIYWDGNQWVVCNQAGMVNMTTDESYSVASYESEIFGSVGEKFKLLKIGAMFEVDNGSLSASVYYRKNGDNDWTLIFTHTPTDSTRYHEAVNIESTGETLPEFEEIEFKVETRRVFLGLKLEFEQIE